MRVLGVSETCDLGALYFALIAEGHEVRVAVSWPLAVGTMAGLVSRSPDWRAELDWVGRDGLIIFEAVSEGLGETQDALRREGYRVVGGSAFGDKLENDRAFAQQLLQQLDLPIAPSRSFTDPAVAQADLAKRPRRCVLKVHGGETYAGQLSGGRDTAAMAAVLPEGRPFLLQDHVDGIETGIGAWFNGQRFLTPACLDWEHKRFFPGDLGELTGEMGTVANFTGAGRLFSATLAPLEPMLREAGHVGWVNLNTIINADGIWPLEFTCRFGHPGFAVLAPLQALGWGELLERVVDPAATDFPVHAGWSVGIVLTTPPFPYSRKEVDAPVGLPILQGRELSPEDRRNLHFGEVGLRDGQLVTSGLYGWTMVVTGTGADIATAQAEALRRIRHVTVPNGRYRTDIGDRLVNGELELLRGLGWLD